MTIDFHVDHLMHFEPPGEILGSLPSFVPKKVYAKSPSCFEFGVKHGTLLSPKTVLLHIVFGETEDGEPRRNNFMNLRGCPYESHLS